MPKGREANASSQTQMMSRVASPSVTHRLSLKCRGRNAPRSSRHRSRRKVLDDDHWLEHGQGAPASTGRPATLDRSRPHLCLVGPPAWQDLFGPYHRASDEPQVRALSWAACGLAEIRCHRRVIVRCPARSCRTWRRPRAQSAVLLDEIDKMSMDFRGDPHRRCSRARPEANATFTITTSKSISTCRR